MTGCAPSLSDLKDCGDGPADGGEIARRHDLDSRLETVLRYGSHLIDHGNGGLALAGDLNRDRRVWLCGCGKRNHDHRAPQPIQCVVRENHTRSGLPDLRSLGRIERNPPDFPALNDRVAHSAIPSSNACQSATSRSSALSRFAARHAAASESSCSDRTSSNNRVTRRDRCRDGTATWNR